MGLEIIRWSSNERVGLPDQGAISDLLLEEMLREKEQLTLRSSTGGRVFGGFELTSLGSGLARLDYGRAILPVVKDQVESQGFFLGLQSPTSYQLDFSAAADDTYYVYVRAVYSDGDFENRVFWDPSGSAEYVDHVATRQKVTWEATYVADDAGSPGSEWIRVWSVTVGTFLITGTTDMRQLFFEGPADSSFAAEWGDGADDRNAARGTYGITDGWTWNQAVRRQVADIIGSPVGAHTFWPAVPIELTQLAVEHHEEAAGALKRGKHKDINFGGDASTAFWKLLTDDSSSYETMFFRAVEEATETPYVQVDLGDAGAGTRMGAIRICPYGSAHSDPQVNNDYCEIEFWGSSGAKEKVSLSATGMAWEWIFAGLNYMQLIESGASQGMRVNLGNISSKEGFQLTAAKNAYIRIPWSSIVTDYSGSRKWHFFGPAAGDVASSDVVLRSIGTISGNDNSVFLEFQDFPDGATLLSIDVSWYANPGGATRAMRMYAARHKNNYTRPSDTHGAKNTALTATGPWSKLALNSVNNYIDHSNDGDAEVTRFKPDQNQTAWDRRYDKLVIGVVPPDDVAATCIIWSVLTRWQYQKTSPWPLSETF